MRQNLRKNPKLFKEIWNKKLKNQIQDYMNHQKELILKHLSILNKGQLQFHKIKQNIRMEYYLQLNR